MTRTSRARRLRWRPSSNANAGDRARSLRGVLLAVIVVVGPGCNRADPEPSPPPVGSVSAAAAVVGNGVRFVSAGSDADFAKVVTGEVARAKAEGRDLLVYVGASWCEPCQRFHDAAKRGELDAAFPRLSLLEADADADGARLKAAAYGANMIPLFAVPGADGRGTSRRIEGSIKGDRAVANIAPRLHELLGK